MPSRWASSCLSKLVFCPTDIRAALHSTPSTGGGFALGALLRVADGVPLASFFLRIDSAVSASTCLFFFFPSPFCFFCRVGFKVMGLGSLPCPFRCFMAFFSPPPDGSCSVVFLAFSFLVVLFGVGLSVSFSESFRIVFFKGPTKLARPSPSSSSSLDNFCPDISPHNPVKSCTF